MKTSEAKAQDTNVRRFRKLVRKLERSAKKKADKKYSELDFWSRFKIGAVSSAEAAYELPFSAIFRGVEYGKAVGGDVYAAYEGRRLQEFSQTSKKAKRSVAKVVATAVQCNMGDVKKTASLMKLPPEFVRKCVKYAGLGEVDIVKVEELALADLERRAKKAEEKAAKKSKEKEKREEKIVETLKNVKEAIQEGKIGKAVKGLQDLDLSKEEAEEYRGELNTLKSQIDEALAARERLENTPNAGSSGKGSRAKKAVSQEVPVPCE